MVCAVIDVVGDKSTKKLVQHFVGNVQLFPGGQVWYKSRVLVDQQSFNFNKKQLFSCLKEVSYFLNLS